MTKQILLLFSHLYEYTILYQILKADQTLQKLFLILLKQHVLC